MSKVALVAGIAGEDGALLADLLPGNGDLRPGGICRAFAFDAVRSDDLHLRCGASTKVAGLPCVVQEAQPGEIRSLGIQRDLSVSFNTLECAINVNGVGSLCSHDEIFILNREGRTRVCQASAPEPYGNVPSAPVRVGENYL